RAEALLDTGNLHLTLLSPSFAARHSLYHPHSGGLLARAEAWTTLRGVVPDASSEAPVITVHLRIRDQEFTLPVAISELGGGEDVLLGLDVLRPLFESGFRIAA
ncbi:MAG: hypothetical protein SGPRY_014929, partial [Prymnesium sp.]